VLCNDVLPAECLHEVSLPVKGERPRESKHARPKALCASRGYCFVASGRPEATCSHVEEETEGFFQPSVTLSSSSSLVLMLWTSIVQPSYRKRHGSLFLTSHESDAHGAISSEWHDEFSSVSLYYSRAISSLTYQSSARSLGEACEAVRTRLGALDSLVCCSKTGVLPQQSRPTRTQRPLPSASLACTR
jgi:hypothetical protein